LRVVKYNDVFNHVETMLYDLYGDDDVYNNVIFVLGYQLIQSLKPIRDSNQGFKIIIIQLEQFYQGTVWAQQKICNILREADEIWDYDEDNAKWLIDNFKLKIKLHPIKYADSLKKLKPVSELSNDDMDIDLLFYGMLHEKRAQLLSSVQGALKGRGKVIDLCGVFGDELDGYISRAKIICNVHFGDHHRQEQVRMFYPVINGRCVVSELSPRDYMKKSIIQIPYSQMSAVIVDLLKTGNWRKQANECSEVFKSITNLYHPQPIDVFSAVPKTLFPW